MKTTRTQLRSIIKEELENIKENYTKIGMREVTAEAKRKIKEEGTIMFFQLRRWADKFNQRYLTRYNDSRL